MPTILIDPGAGSAALAKPAKVATEAAAVPRNKRRFMSFIGVGMWVCPENVRQEVAVQGKTQCSRGWAGKRIVETKTAPTRDKARL
jgi:hypothetical protein